MSKLIKAWERNGTRRPFPSMYEASKNLEKKYGLSARIMLNRNIVSGVINR